MKRVICFCLTILVVLFVSASASALDYGCDVETVSEAVYLENLDTGAVIFTKNADEKMYPASTTKIMTYVVVADNVADFDGTMVTIKEDVFDDIDPESTVMGLKDHVGEEYSIRDLLYGMMLPSGNDAALVLADYVGSGIPGFVEMMNSKAAELGCNDTHFVNPHGLHDPDHYTTARDMATIAKYARTLQSFMEITNTVSYTPARFNEPLTNTNYMINNSSKYVEYYYPNVKGIKTGYTDEAGKCLVTTAEKDDFTYLCVALGAAYSYEEDVNYAMKDTASLYDWVFDNLSQQTLYGPSDVVKTVTINKAQGEDRLNLVSEGELSALLPKSFDRSKIRIEVDCKDSFDAPVSKGDVLGTATVYYDDLVVGTTNIVASKDVEKSKSSDFAGGVFEWMGSHVLVIILGVAFVIVMIVLAFVLFSSGKKSKKRYPRNGQNTRNTRNASGMSSSRNVNNARNTGGSRSRSEGRRYRD